MSSDSGNFISTVDTDKSATATTINDKVNDSSNVLSASTGPPSSSSQVSPSYSEFQINTLGSSERINPFDKNKQIITSTKTTSDVITLTKPVESTSITADNAKTSASLSSSSSSQSASDDSTKKYRSQSSSSRYGQSSVTDSYGGIIRTESSIVVTTASTTSSYTSATDFMKSDPSYTSSSILLSSKPETTKIESSRRTDAAKYAFGTAQYSTGSMSDSEVIFGSTDLPNYTTSSPASKLSYGRSSFAGTSMDTSDSLYAPKKESKTFNRSLSVSSDTNGDFANDPRVNASYRIYEGIQNAGFQDFDSPVKTSTTTTTIADTTNYSSTSSCSTKRYSLDDDDDEYDLK